MPHLASLVVCICVVVDSTAKTRSNLEHRKSIRLVGRTRNRAEAYGWIFTSTTPRTIVIIILILQTMKEGKFFFCSVFCFLFSYDVLSQASKLICKSRLCYGRRPEVVGTLWVFVLSKFAYHELSEREKKINPSNVGQFAYFTENK